MRGACLVLALFLAPACTSDAAPASDSFDQAHAWQQLEAIVAYGERPAGSTKNRALREHLAGELHALGLSPVVEGFRERTPIGELEFANVWADVAATKGAADAAPIVVLCTHFDTKRMPFAFLGANDGGSGTAVLLELARSLASSERPRPVTYRVVFLDGEEATRPWWEDPDNTYGSKRFVEDLGKSGELPRVRACVLLDMVGDADLRLTTERASTPALLELFFEAARGAGLGAHIDGPAKEISDDHQPFLAAGIPSVDLIDFDYGPGNSLWHSAKDTLEGCSADSLGAIGRIVLAGLPRLEALVTRPPR